MDINKLTGRLTTLLILLLAGWGAVAPPQAQAQENADEYLLSVSLPDANGPKNVDYMVSSDSGSIPDGEEIYVPKGETVTMWWYPNGGYKTDAISINVEYQQIDDNQIQFTMPEENVALTVNFRYDPDSPSDPIAKYKLALECNPRQSGSTSGSGYYEAGTPVGIYVWEANGYVFQNWTDENNNVVSTETYIDYTMPASDKKLTANFVYDPNSPADPMLRLPLKVTVSPSNAGGYYRSAEYVVVDDSYWAEVYPNHGYKFKGWTLNGQPIKETSMRVEGVMTEDGADYVAEFIYDPDSPVDPLLNYYDPQTGLMIIDHFSPGTLREEIDKLVGGEEGYRGVYHLVVKGVLDEYDLNVLDEMYNTAVVDLSRTSGCPTFRRYGNDNDMVCMSIMLPADVESMGDGVFNNWPNLTSVEVYRTVPPTCTEETFAGFANIGNCVLHVPAEAMELYKEATGWKDFIIMPLTTELRTLTVRLPEECADGRYKNSRLELVNTNNGIRQRYVISDRIAYSFLNLQRNEQFNAYLTSPLGFEIGKIEDILIEDEDLERTFDPLPALKTVSVKVTTPEGEDVSEEVNVDWYQKRFDDTNAFLRKGVTLGEAPVGQRLACGITLSRELTMYYTQPDVMDCEVADTDDGNFTLEIALAPLPEMEVCGQTVDFDLKPIADASVTVSALVNDLYSTRTASTGKDGKWSVTIPVARDYIIHSAAEGYITRRDTIQYGGESLKLDLGYVGLVDVPSARITYSVSVRQAAAPGETAELLPYDDIRNVDITGYNTRLKKTHRDVINRYPQFVISDEELLPGDSICVTLRSTKGAFPELVETVALDENLNAEVNFETPGLGGIKAIYERTDNDAVIGMLYDAEGQLVQKQEYSLNENSMPTLEAGKYTLVTVGKSSLVNGVQRLSMLAQVGLTEGTDYLRNDVEVSDGVISVVQIKEVPAFDENRFKYTSDRSSFTVNKATVSLTNYLTLKSSLYFKSNFEPEVKNVAMIYDLPAGSELVEGSVMKGVALSEYTYKDHRLTVELGDNGFGEQIRFVSIPTKGGDATYSAYVRFELDGNEIVQPMGNATSKVKELELSVPSRVASVTVPVVGFAPARSKVEIYDGQTLIGEVKALANGTWSANCTLKNPSNLSRHSIHAVITTTTDLVLKSAAAECVYDANSNYAKSVLMTLYNEYLSREVSVNFNIEKGVNSDVSYMFFKTCEISFLADFADNNPDLMSDVYINVFTDGGNVLQLPAVYDQTKDRWVASKVFSDKELPVNVSTDFFYNKVPVVDNNNMAGIKTRINSLEADVEVEMPEVKSIDVDFASMSDEELENYARSLKLPADVEPFGVSFGSVEANVDKTRTAILSIADCSDLDEASVKADSEYMAFAKDNGENIYVKHTGDTYSILDFDNALRAEASVSPADNVVVPEDLKAIPAYVTENAAKLKALSDAMDKEYQAASKAITATRDEAQKAYDEAISAYGALAYAMEEVTRRNEEAASDESGEPNRWADLLPEMQANLAAASEKALAAAKNLDKTRELSSAFAEVFSPLTLEEAGKNAAAATTVWSDIFTDLNQLADPTEEAAAKVIEDARGALATMLTLYTSRLASRLAALRSLSNSEGVATGLAFFNADIWGAVAGDWQQELLANELRHAYSGMATADGSQLKLPEATASHNPDVTPIHDPSGYVYEAVPSNRLQGVEATCYYREVVENIYGDLEEHIGIWNAEEYNQQNPLFTDENGMYQWDVPQGTWQVRFAKDGYLAAQSEWLPVPPPQLEVNIPMVRDRQPEVAEAHAYAKAVEVKFDEYMDIATVNPDNTYITVTADATSEAEIIKASIEVVDGENASPLAGVDAASDFATTFRLVPEEELTPTMGTIRLIVSRNVESYAGIGMNDDYSQELDLEKEISQISADGPVQVLYGGEKTITVNVGPDDAAVGKALVVENATPSIMTVAENEFVIDENGQAKVEIHGDIPGQGMLKFSVRNSGAKGEVGVNVVTELYEIDKPVASRANNSEVYYGTKIKLTSEVPGALIYYTLDGSSPSDVDTRMKYVVPVEITDETHIKAIVSTPANVESEVAEFNYTLKKGIIDFTMPQGWSWISHSLNSPVSTLSLFEEENVERVVGQTSEMIRDPQIGPFGNLDELKAEQSYKVQASAATSRQRFEDLAWNPETYITLKAGWNWLGYPLDQTMTPDEAFANANPGKGDMIVSQDGFVEYDGDAWVGTLAAMNPGSGYMYLASAERDMQYNSALISNAKALMAGAPSANVMGEFVVDPHKYPDIMPVTATLVTPEGEDLDNAAYQVNAFCDTECRGVGQLVNGLFMMNVYGESGDEIAFHVMSEDGETVYSSDNKVVFTADALGSLDNPYLLYLNSATGIDKVEYDGNVKVSVSNKRLYIYGVEADTVELVEAYATDGVKRIHASRYTEAGVSADALDPGVFVVVVKADGHYSYHRIAVR